LFNKVLLDRVKDLTALNKALFRYKSFTVSDRRNLEVVVLTLKENFLKNKGVVSLSDKVNASS
jgi:hypothetical protein